MLFGCRALKREAGDGKKATQGHRSYKYAKTQHYGTVCRDRYCVNMGTISIVMNVSGDVMRNP